MSIQHEPALEPDQSTPDEPPVAWRPTPRRMEDSNIARAMRKLGLGSFAELHRWSIERREEYWAFVIEHLRIRLRRAYSRILDCSRGTADARWLAGARMNIVESCFGDMDRQCALIYRGSDGGTERMNYIQLRTLANRVSNGLVALGLAPGDAVGIIMPMTPECIAIYLGVMQAGCVAIPIADSFAAAEIDTRLRIGAAKLVFAQGDVDPRQAPRPTPYEKLCTKCATPAVVVMNDNRASESPPRPCDLSWSEFLSDQEDFNPLPCDPHDAVDILFSSGTTGDPKAIPWDHTTPIKCAADGHFHQDIRPGDVVCWPTNLGWMMGPWLIFAALINRASIALYGGSPASPDFGKFVHDAGVTMLGVIPSLVRKWRETRCMSGMHWRSIRLFSSTGECSMADDMAYLLSLADNATIIEYCGGTEIGGGYLTGTVADTCIPTTFTTAALGLDMVILDEEGNATDKGEAFLIGPSIGLSTKLLNGDNKNCYYHDTPLDHRGEPLRRHGDQLERVADGRFRMLGRADDTMNLGGIKVSAAEIERVLDQLDRVIETAAIAVASQDGGPSRLVIYAVIKDGAFDTNEVLRRAMQLQIKSQLNPLFKIHEVRIAPSLPRTVSGKVMRRSLRQTYDAGDTT